MPSRKKPVAAKARRRPIVILGDRVKAACEKSFDSQLEAAIAFDMYPHELSRVWNNRQSIRVETLRRICEATKTSADYFLGLSNDPAIKR